jgi:2-polyprenyl-3-methyl-5-hydroxy-6-metoxy-1,4-benzoquinol methylase
MSLCPQMRMTDRVNDLITTLKGLNGQRQSTMEYVRTLIFVSTQYLFITMSTQSSQYNNISGHYDSIQQLTGNLIDTATLLTYVGDIEGLEVLDLACGSGFYSRKAIQRRARRVVGLDISCSMIEAACRECEGDSCIEFYVTDCSKPLNVGPVRHYLCFLVSRLRCQRRGAG